MKRLENKIAVVTGGAGGIGAATASRLAAEGATVVVADINYAGAEEVSARIQATGARAVAVKLDLAATADIAALFERVRDEFGGLDILHNNAADTRPEQLARDATVADLEEDVWDQAFAVNAKGTMLMLKHGIRLMLNSGGGSIINTSSTASLRGSNFNPSYAATKAAINSLTLNVAMQYGRQGIRCNAVLPGLIMTPVFERSFSPEATDCVTKQILTPYYGRPDDIAGVVAFLASEDARFMTGQVLTVDGGMLSHMPWSADMAALFAGSS